MLNLTLLLLFIGYLASLLTAEVKTGHIKHLNGSVMRVNTCHEFGNGMHDIGASSSRYQLIHTGIFYYYNYY